MATFQVTVYTADGQSGGSFDPTSLLANAGDLVTFISQHKGNSPPDEISINFASGNICQTDGKSSQNQLVLSGNGSANVMVCSNAGKEQVLVTYQLGNVDEADPDPIFDDDD
ncbi:MAG: hypothetical protein ACE5I1_06640 [bacterium]